MTETHFKPSGDDRNWTCTSVRTLDPKSDLDQFDLSCNQAAFVLTVFFRVNLECLSNTVATRFELAMLSPKCPQATSCCCFWSRPIPWLVVPQSISRSSTLPSELLFAFGLGHRRRLATYLIHSEFHADACIYQELNPTKFQEILVAVTKVWNRYRMHCWIQELNTWSSFGMNVAYSKTCIGVKPV